MFVEWHYDMRLELILLMRDDVRPPPRARVGKRVPWYGSPV